MKKLVKKSMKFNASKECVELLKDISNGLLSIATLFKYSEITTTGLYHDSIVDNFHEFSEKYNYYAWQISMLLSSYMEMADLSSDLSHPSNEKITNFLSYMIEKIQESMMALQVVRDKLNQEGDFSAVYVLEEIMGNSRMHLAELIKLNDQRSLP